MFNPFSARLDIVEHLAKTVSLSRELKHATFLGHERQPEVNILQAKTLVSPGFSSNRLY